ncbi:MAG: hypothetical protein JWQ01_4813 [Massilia sp.]|nr:hypothetical protein [Massilia sp.]
MTPAKAYSKVKMAIEKGTITRPDSCERCGVIPAPTTDGRASIQAHHHDYSKPLDVEWICAKCHRKETPLPAVMGAPNPGERNGSSKLTEVEVVSARRLRQQGATYKSIADRFGVVKTTAMRAVKGERWAHVQPIPLAAAPALSERALSLTPTDLSKRLRATVGAVMLMTDREKLMIDAADEIERYYGGMMAWKQTAEKKDADLAGMKRTQDAMIDQIAIMESADEPEVEAPSAGSDEPTERESLIACLEDDAAKLADANPGDEMAQTMRDAARLLELDAGVPSAGSVGDDPEFDSLLTKLESATARSEWDEGKACKELRGEFVRHIDGLLSAARESVPALTPVEAYDANEGVDGEHPRYGRGIFFTLNCMKTLYEFPLDGIAGQSGKDGEPE